uniref:Chaperone DnaJ C-terminal domain-containing protein n=1 Tax=Spongospora subterranea TaxID=70186 RepID=A0A0H5RDV6_9EUKA|eukprot:CRZ06734.1 hypothetical protein [Spongospora subterranea]
MVDERVMAESLPVRAVLQIEPIKCVIYAALEEIYSGFLRSVTITRQIMNHDQKTSSDQEVTLKVPIAKGAIAGTKVLFESAGHQRQGQTGHVEFEIRIAPHPIYRREGDNLVVKKELYITEALTGGSVRISTLDGRTLSIAISKVILPGSRTLVSGEGLIGPTGNRGDLFIEYQVKYPDQISLANKQALRHLLPVPVDG